MDVDGKPKDLTVLHATSSAFSTFSHNKEQKETASFS